MSWEINRIGIQFSIWHISLFLVVGVFGWIIYTKIIVAYLQFQSLKKSLKDKYKIYQYPYRPFGLSVMALLRNDFKNHNDSLYTRKTQFQNYDLTLGIVKQFVLVTLINPDLIKQMTERQKEGCYVKSNTAMMGFLGTGLLTAENDQWKYKRKIMASFFNHDFIKSKISSIIKITNQFCKEQKSHSKDGKVTIQVELLLQKIFGNVVIKCFFGTVDFDLIDGRNVFEFLRTLLGKMGQTNIMISSLLLPPIIRRKGLLRKIDREINNDISTFKVYAKNIINKIIKQINSHKDQNQSQQGQVAKLIRNNKLVETCGQQQKIQKGLYTYQDLVQQICTFFFAGTDTTASVMASLIQRLITHKSVQEKIRAEIKEVLNDDISNINVESMRKMTYVEYVQNQIIRLMSPVPNLFPRQAVKDHMIGDILVTKGSYINAELLANHYKESYYDDPFQFRPERWEKIPNPPTDPYSYFPFSIGPRVCIGQQLSLVESKIAIIIFMLTFKNAQQKGPYRYKSKITYGLESSKMQFDLV